MKCKTCGVPLKGLRYRILSRFRGIKPSTKYSSICSKCEPVAKPKKKAVRKKSAKKKAKPKARKKKKR